MPGIFYKNIIIINSPAFGNLKFIRTSMLVKKYHQHDLLFMLYHKNVTLLALSNENSNFIPHTLVKIF